jgi:hypothetical protein
MGGAGDGSITIEGFAPRYITLVVRPFRAEQLPHAQAGRDLV